MARIILVTGGCRSGKSVHALRLAQALDGQRAYVATCPVVDDEMRKRIANHRRQRRNWKTIEEELDLASVLRGNREYEVVIVDCLTLWVSNLMRQAEQAGRYLDEAAITRRCRALLAACRQRRGTVIFVTNEVGAGIVPDNALARRFRDLAGRCNQVMADGAGEVIFMVCGLPLTLKRISA